MTSSISEKTEAGEPSSYQRMEHKLSKIAAQAGENTQEASKVKEESFLSKNLVRNSVSSNEVKKARDETNDTNAATKTTTKSMGTPPDDIKSQLVGNSIISAKKVNVKAGLYSDRTIETNPDLDLKQVTEEMKESKKVKSTQSLDKQPQNLIVVSRPEQPNLGSKPLHSDSKSGKVPSNDASATSEVLSEPPRVIHTTISNRMESYTSPHANPPVRQVLTIGSSTKSKSGTTLRRGKWTMEEEAYVARVIQDFNSGFLNAPAGTTLRSYLSEKLQCDPMRITKKFTGDACIGKRVFHPAVRSAGNAAAIDKAQAELDALERRWRRRLEMQQRESAKKAAASAAAASAASQSSRGHGLIQGIPLALLSTPSQQIPSSVAGQSTQQNVVTQAASWLDRANALLKGNASDRDGQRTAVAPTGSGSFDAMPSADIESEMKEVQRLIYEGPIIQQTTAALPQLLHPGNLSSQVSTTDQTRTSSTASDRCGAAEPADKRMRTASLSGAEDAEALVGFLRSVRASAAAASGQNL